MANRNLNRAKGNKRDEFYTMLKDIKKEMVYYKDCFKDKVVYLNCDNPSFSNFWTYFYNNFKSLGLKRLMSTYYADESFLTEYDGENVYRTKLNSNGDFRSPECINILKRADVVVTNPPFSLFRDFVSLMTEYKKDFILIGSMNAVTYKEVFPLIRDGKLRLGYNKGRMSFYIPDDDFYKNSIYSYINHEGRHCKSFGNIVWYSTLDSNRTLRVLELDKEYSAEKYPKYDNYDAIEVSKVKNIPKDYKGIMGVPITYLHSHNPKQFKILGCTYKHGRPKEWDESTIMKPTINGKETYKRIFIKRNEE